MDSSRMVQRLEGIDGLPTLPLVLRQIQKVMRDERAGMAQIAAVVAKDQALASRAIRLVNSAWYGRSGRVTSIQQVLVTLGLKTLSTLMLGLSIVKIFDASRTHGFNINSFWEHAFGTALLARKIALQANGGSDAEACFVAGLLHDMGRLVMEQYMHDDYVAALQLTQSKNMTLLSAEMEIFGFSHADAGAWLGQRWDIPKGFVWATAFHHTAPMPAEVLPSERMLVKVVSIANELCTVGGIGNSGEPVHSPGRFLASSGLTPDTRNRLVEEAHKEVAGTIYEWNCG